jgi:hypothetical protein
MIECHQMSYHELYNIVQAAAPAHEVSFLHGNYCTLDDGDTSFCY